MSIIICVVEKDKTFYLASDKRAIKNGIIKDNYKKIYELKRHVYFSMTGIAEVGLGVLAKIQDKINLPIKDFLIEVDNEVIVNNKTLTVMISGIDENNKLFIWQKNNSGDIRIVDLGPDLISYSISSNDNSDLFEEHLRKCIISGRQIQYCIADTINYASSIDYTISSGYDLIMFEK